MNTFESFYNMCGTSIDNYYMGSTKFLKMYWPDILVGVLLFSELIIKIVLR